MMSAVEAQSVAKPVLVEVGYSVRGVRALARAERFPAPGATVYFRVWFTSYFGVATPVDVVILVGDYDPATETFTYYPPIVFLDNVSIPANTTGTLDTGTFSLPSEWGGGARDVLVIACEMFDPATGEITGLYDQYLEEDCFTIETMSVTDVALLTV